MFTGRVLRNNNLPKVARSFVRGSADLSDHSVIMSSHMCVYKADSDAVRALSMDWFVESALGYRLSGEPTRCLCEHNANVASRLSRSQVAQTWRLLRLMCPSSVTTFSASHTVPSQPPTVCSLPASLPLTDTGIQSCLPVINSICMNFTLRRTTVSLFQIEWLSLLMFLWGHYSHGICHGTAGH